MVEEAAVMVVAAAVMVVVVAAADMVAVVVGAAIRATIVDKRATCRANAPSRAVAVVVSICLLCSHIQTHFFFHLQVAVVVVAEAVRATTAARKATCHATVRRRVRAVVAVSSS
jgi:hypothetical protein